MFPLTRACRRGYPSSQVRGPSVFKQAKSEINGDQLAALIRDHRRHKGFKLLGSRQISELTSPVREDGPTVAGSGLQGTC